MATIMTWSTPEGIKGRCDGRCHNATGTKCNCMCGGRFHGAARNGTLDSLIEEQGRVLFESIRQEAIARGIEIEIVDTAILFHGNGNGEHLSLIHI